jgi:EF hand
VRRDAFVEKPNAGAEQTGKRMSTCFSKAGGVSIRHPRNYAIASAAKRFELMDINRDGKVTASEVSASRAAESIAWASKLSSPTEKLSQLDTNRDGASTVKEYADSSQKVFDRLELDGDGVLSDAEMLMPSRKSGR